MTSSLVGSEMCIRDRVLSDILKRRREVGSMRSIAESTEGAPHGGQTSISVSYTHLTLPTICSV
eukprot:12768956-Prorocentrum_lima.AAC.1